MVSIQNSIPIHASNVIDTSKFKTMNIHEAPDDFYQAYIRSEKKILESLYNQPIDTSSHQNYQPYAAIIKNGKTIAQIDNNGFVQSSNTAGSKIHSLLKNENTSLSGPALAQERAAKIAALVGGKVEISSSALSQSEFNSSLKPQVTINYQAMMKDSGYEQLQKTKTARVLFLAQQMATEQNSKYKISDN